MNNNHVPQMEISLTYETEIYYHSVLVGPKRPRIKSIKNY